jgi:hypothetical protein
MMRRVRSGLRETFHRRSKHGQDPTEWVSIVRRQRGGHDDGEFKPLTALFQHDPTSRRRRRLVWREIARIASHNLDHSREYLLFVPQSLARDLDSTGNDQFHTDSLGDPRFVHDDLDLPVQHLVLLRLLDLIHDAFTEDFEFRFRRVDEDDRFGDMELDLTFM